MIQFRAQLQQRINDILVPAVGQGSDPAEYIKTFSNRLTGDTEIKDLPTLIIIVRNAEKLAPPEIGMHGMQRYTWTVHIYYMDIELNMSNFDVADQRRDHIVGRVEKALELNPLLQLNNQLMQTTDTDGSKESVYASSIQLINFDDSGQSDRHSFITEIMFEVYTDRS